MPARYAKPGEDGRGIKLYQDVVKDGVVKRQAKRQLLWGDWLNIVSEDGEWGVVNWRGEKTYFVKMSDTQAERPLDIVFVDVGQGDGCFIAAPHPTGEKWIVVDAGADDNMARYLGSRFRLARNSIRMHAAVVTHSDMDHYGGFQDLLKIDNLTFDHLYHNGIAERAGPDIFGPIDDGWLTDLRVTHAETKALYADPANVYSKPAEKKGMKQYPKLMLAALQDKVDDIAMLSTATAQMDGGRAWMPGFGPSDTSDLTIEVLGPVVEPDTQNRPRLRTFGAKVGSRAFDDGKTKNGHSVLLKLRYRGFSLILGGDLNRPAEDFLLRHYGEIGPDAPLSDALPKASQRLRADMLKSCHHGSSDVTDEFLRAVEPHGFVVSSGEEGYAHPRPDLLGRLGRFGRGNAPLILCTELLRSTREREDGDALATLRRLDARIESGALSTTDLQETRAERDELQRVLTQRNVDVYGAITLRTDGRLLVIAFRHEKPKEAAQWQTFWYEDGGGSEGFVPVWRASAH